MIKPTEVKEAFERVEDENWAFRGYLKKNANPDKLDKQFLKLHKELFKNYDCSKCRNCCKEYTGAFDDNELESASKILNMTENEFVDKYMNKDVDGYELKGIPCCLMNEDGSCQIEKCKPLSCKEYPFTDKPGRFFSLYNIIGFTRVCPVVFEMVESLKEIYNFRGTKRRRY